MRRRRHAFTLVEMLVAMALIIFIMAILSQAFVAATQVFRDLKSASDMAEKLRAATGLMRRYLAADHFEGKRRLSDPNFWLEGPPREGFFRVWHGSPSPVEGTEPDGSCPTYLSTTHALHFAVKLRGNQRSDYFSTTVPLLANGSPSTVAWLPASATPTAASVYLWQAQPETRYEDSMLPSYLGSVYNWQWAEVAFFLRPTGDNANGTPLYGLYLRQALAVPDAGSGTGLVIPASQQIPSQQSQIPGYLEVSCRPSNPLDLTQPLYFNSPLDLSMPARRFNMMPTNLTGWPVGWPNTGNAPPYSVPSNPYPYPIYAEQTPQNVTMAAADLLLANVISFDVRLLTAQPPSSGEAFEDLFQLTSPTRQPNHYPVNNSAFIPGTGPLVFDTWSSNQDDTYDYSNWMPPTDPTQQTPTTIPIYANTPQGVPITIRAVQVILRIWDEKTQLTRQVTFVQAL